MTLTNTRCNNHFCGTKHDPVKRLYYQCKTKDGECKLCKNRETSPCKLKYIGYVVDKFVASFWMCVALIVILFLMWAFKRFSKKIYMSWAVSVLFFPIRLVIRSLLIFIIVFWILAERIMNNAQKSWGKTAFVECDRSCKESGHKEILGWKDLFIELSRNEPRIKGASLPKNLDINKLSDLKNLLSNNK